MTKTNLNVGDLIVYELPSISEYVSFGPLQTMVARYVAWKVKRKLIRYKQRLDRADFVKSITSSKSK